MTTPLHQSLLQDEWSDGRTLRTRFPTEPSEEANSAVARVSPTVGRTVRGDRP